MLVGLVMDVNCLGVIKLRLKEFNSTQGYDDIKIYTTMLVGLVMDVNFLGFCNILKWSHTGKGYDVYI